MDLKSFSMPSGKLVKNSGGNFAFLPDSLPPKIDYEKLIMDISEADRSLSTLSGMGQLLPNPHILISPYIRREAVFSSRIEGTQASLSDLFLYETVGIEPKAYLRLREVKNYINTTEMCLNRLKRGDKLSLELIKNAHKTLLYRVRGHDRHPGEFRRIQNFIVPPPSTNIEDAIFVPPPPEDILVLLNELEQFIANPPRNIPPLLQCAIIHYQFETIHPFIDGNGRIGRLMITLFLCERNLMTQPLLYLSAFFDRYKGEYYDRLTAVREKSDWTGWFKFFLSAVSYQSRETIENVQQILNLQKKYDERLLEAGATKNAHILADALFKNPYTTVKSAGEYLDVSFPTAQSTINALEKAGILQEYSHRKRNRIYVAKDLFKILQPGDFKS